MVHGFAHTDRVCLYSWVYGITLKIAKFFAFGCLVHKDGCYVTPAVR